MRGPDLPNASPNSTTATSRLLAGGRGLKFIGYLARDRQLGYFETNARRMHYARFRDLGMFVGSGAVEAGCKAVIGQRLKLSGMRWSIPGAASIATPRCQEASNRWEQIWQRPHNQTPAADLTTGKLILLLGLPRFDGQG